MKNWKTTLAGAFFGGIVAVQPILASGHFDLGALITGFGIAFVGALAKDFNKTGV